MAEKTTTQLETVEPAIVEQSSGGKTIIESSVIAKVIGLAIREVPGVHALGGGMSRVVGAVRGAIGSTDLTQGVSVEMGEVQVAADIVLVARYPYPLQAIADEVRLAAATAIVDLVGMEPAEINVTIGDVHIPGEQDAEDTDERRVQ